MMNSKTCSKCNNTFPATTEYFSKNKSCLYGLNSICKSCIKEYRKNYYQKNADKLKADSKKYVSENADAVKQYRKKYYQDNKEQLSEKNRQWNLENKEKMDSYRRKWKEKNSDSDKRYYENNKEKLLKRNAKYRSENHELMRFYKRKWKVINREKIYHNEKIRRSNKTEGYYTIAQWDDARKYFDFKCAYCGNYHENLTQDHFIPLSKGGTYTDDNIIPICAKCNSSKWNNDFEEWYKKQPFFDELRMKKVEEYLKNKITKVDK